MLGLLRIEKIPLLDKLLEFVKLMKKLANAEIITRIKNKSK